MHYNYVRMLSVCMECRSNSYKYEGDWVARCMAMDKKSKHSDCPRPS